LMIKSGGEVDKQELAGVANMTANLLTKGTATRSATQIAEAIEALGASITSSAAWDGSGASVNVMSSKLAPALAILADVTRRPAFKDEEIERLRAQTLDDLTVAMTEPGSIAGYVAARVVFGDAPYGHPLAGTTESIKLIGRADIVQLHARYYRPDNAVLVFGGDIKPAVAFMLANRFFGDWKKPAGALPRNPSATPVATTSARRVIVIDKPDAGQAAVLVARTGIDRKDSDYYKGIVTNTVLSGYSGRLNQEIRIKRGLSYGARSTLDARREVGSFIASSQTKNQSGAEVAQLLMGELGRLTSAPPVDAELTPRKAVLVGNFSRSLETADGLVQRVGNLALYGVSLDEINRYITNVQAITSNDVKSFAASRLDEKTTNVIVVGNAKEFLNDLRKHFDNVEVIPVAELDLNTALLRKKPAGQ
jgi:zinc protease